MVYGPELRLVRRFEKPTLGICGGHQLLAIAFRGQIDRLGRTVRGLQRIRIVERDPIFESLSDEALIWQHHHDHVSRLPEGFKLLASSAATKVEAMRHTTAPLYGVQFHPERFDKGHPDGCTVLSNFCRIADGYHGLT